MRGVLAALAAVIVGVFVGTAAEAAIQIHVDQTNQRMTVRENGEIVAQWPVSTARKGKITHNGNFRPQSLRQRHFSSLYNNAPMPYSIFYSGNFAIHGTTAVRQLGRPASAGCVRLHTDNARTLFQMVQRHGMGRTRITITGRAPVNDPNINVAERRRDQRATQTARARATADAQLMAFAPATRDRALRASDPDRRSMIVQSTAERRALERARANAQRQAAEAQRVRVISPAWTDSGVSPHWQLRSMLR